MAVSRRPIMRATCLIIFTLFTLVAFQFDYGCATISYARKPILAYLLRYKLGQIKHKLNTLKYGHHHDVPVLEEHHHHFYFEPLPVGGIHLEPPTIIHAGKVGHGHFSLYSPHIKSNINYHNYWDYSHDPQWL